MLSCASNPCGVINMTWTNNKQVFRDAFSSTWYALTNERRVKQWIHCFLVNKYIDDHHVDEKHEVECDKKGGIFPGTFSDRSIETWDANTCLGIKPEFCFYFIVSELIWNSLLELEPRLKCGMWTGNLMGYGDEVIFGNCVSFEEMVGKPNFRHKITRFQWKPWKKSKKWRKQPT